MMLLVSVLALTNVRHESIVLEIVSYEIFLFVFFFFLMNALFVLLNLAKNTGQILKIKYFSRR